MLVFLLLACTGASPDTGAPDDTASPSTACWDDFSPGDVATLAPGFEGGTEGAAFADGRLYVSRDDALVELGADGTATSVATLDSALGLAPSADGLYVAAPGEFTLDGSGADGTLLEVVDGAVTTVASGMPNPNFVATTAWGEVLVSDDTAAIYSVDPGTGDVKTWTDAVPSPNGMGFSPDGRALYVVTTFEPDPPLWRVPVTDGVAGTPEAIVAFETGAAPDGLAVDAAGGVWVALNLAGSLVRIDPATGEETDRISGLDTPASLAFGSGDTFDPCSLYVTSLFGDEVVRVATGFEGLAIGG